MDGREQSLHSAQAFFTVLTSGSHSVEGHFFAIGWVLGNTKVLEN